VICARSTRRAWQQTQRMSDTGIPCDRIRERLERIGPWLSMNGIEKFLDKGRKTEDYILKDMHTQTECRFRCISADKSAHVRVRHR
jgi:hypothetical protein